MVKVEYSEPNDPKWIAWKAECTIARQRVIDEFDNTGNVTIDEKLYRKMKKLLFEAFHDKCAFCENPVLVSQHGEVEHFRPKKDVTNENDDKVRVTWKTGVLENQEIDHPGYFWLAYDWMNLLPSCIKCNQRSNGDKGEKFGKRNRFPIKSEEFRACQVDGEVHEEYTLIHPRFDNPAEHLRIEADTGIMFARTPRGQMCIDILGLNRDQLVDARKMLFTDVNRCVLTAINQNFQKQSLDSILKELRGHTSGKLPYTMAREEIIKWTVKQSKIDIDNLIMLLFS